MGTYKRKQESKKNQELDQETIWKTRKKKETRSKPRKKEKKTWRFRFPAGRKKNNNGAKRGARTKVKAMPRESISEIKLFKVNRHFIFSS